MGPVVAGYALVLEARGTCVSQWACMCAHVYVVLCRCLRARMSTRLRVKTCR